MKTEIHPQYYTDAKVTCSCGNTFTVGSTQKEIHVEICSACHPFFKGHEKVIDAAGRVERFKARKAAAKAPATKKEKAAAAPKVKAPKKKVSKS
jgi:large subunit ribosomal protein L31